MKSINDIKDILERYERPYRSLNGFEIERLYEVYNHLYQKAETPTTCMSCVEEIYQKLYLIYKETNATPKT